MEVFIENMNRNQDRERNRGQIIWAPKPERGYKIFYNYVRYVLILIMHNIFRLNSKILEWIKRIFCRGPQFADYVIIIA